MARHLAHALPHGIIGVAGDSPVSHAIRHDLVMRVRFIGDEPHSDVTIRHYPYKPIISVNHRKRAEIPIAHQPGCVSDPIVRINCDYIARHQVARAHIVGGVAGPPVFPLTLASLGFILIPASPPLGFFVT